MLESGWPYGLNSETYALLVRVSNELGAGHPKSTAFSVVVVTVVSFIMSIFAAVVVLLLRHKLSYAFTEGEAVAAAVSDLPLLALTLLLNGVQPVLSGNMVRNGGGHIGANTHPTVGDHSD
ncbi:protein TRANSPARENT TESTA 12 [Pyrus ussuriensis x Pyrus communis]|uniref:Protein TRANSPARENT TESTA 12 n=1 Tax=Pyrus ussuriensis x Pyrus communis TaxID=2448454 RepID=A0A5N5GDR9_9ROSA|nr:protein TRANSPARENT TESTA 12 [Pyrus ussuriensis x Pyrus communis]